MLTKGKWNKLLRSSLRNTLKKSYEETPIEYSDPIIKPRKFEKFALGFELSPQLVRDNLYSTRRVNVRKKIKKLTIKTHHTIDVNGGGVELNGKEYYINAMRTDKPEDIKQLIQALNMILKVSKKGQ